MRKVLLPLLLVAVANTHCADSVTQKKHVLGYAACSTMCFVAGAWLAHGQLPRMAGQQIEFDAPLFTKAFASILFAIGITGGITGAYSLAMQIRDKLNNV